MKKLLILAIVAWVSMLSFSATSFGNGLTIPFSDTNYYWGQNSGWDTGRAWNTDVPNGVWDGNNRDVIGDPDITGGTVTFNAAGNVTRITFNYYAPQSDWRMLAPGNLFVNVLTGDNDTMWDYVVTTMGTATSGTVDGSGVTLAEGYYNIYNISSKNISAQRGVNDGSYILSGADNTGYWAGWYLRNNHPIGIQSSVLSGLTPGSAYYSGFPGTGNGTRLSYYDFGTSGLATGGNNIIIGWAMTCANDVIYANEVNNPVPEPATLLLLGLGLLGLGVVTRKKFKN